MKITEIKKIKFFSNRFQIFFENGSFFNLSKKEIDDFNLSENQEYNDNIYNQLKIRELNYLQKYAANYFKKFSSSITKFKEKLLSKKFSPDNINIIINKLQNENLLNDNLYAKKIIIDLINKNKYSKLEIKKRLLNKKINYDLIDNYLNELYNKDIEEKIKENIIKKLKTKGYDKNSIYKYLKNKGF
ncbi:MAG TPA: RecX family transcriptional regulator [bacterium]|nr:RecX family transcriptional regulator [bacterium]HOL46995.1 RecX family transcriptional regulator [bacterium]HPQ19009.1 RecX family transcriptional regulator [bacterium]